MSTSKILTFWDRLEKNVRALQRVNAILILLLLYGLAMMKFTWIFFLENHEMQLGVQLSSQVSICVF